MTYLISGTLCTLFSQLPVIWKLHWGLKETSDRKMNTRVINTALQKGSKWNNMSSTHHWSGRDLKASVLWCMSWLRPSFSCRETAVQASLLFWSSSLASRCLRLQNSWTRDDIPDNFFFFFPDISPGLNKRLLFLVHLSCKEEKSVV